MELSGAKRAREQWKKGRGEAGRRQKEDTGCTEPQDKANSVYKFAVEFAFPSFSNFRSRPAFLYDRRISNLREISGATLFQRFRGFPVPDFNGGAGRARKFFLPSSCREPSAVSPLPFYGQNFALNFLHSFSVHSDTEGSGAFHYLRKHVTSARRICRDSACTLFHGQRDRRDSYFFAKKKKKKRNTRKFADPKVERRQWIHYEVTDDCSNVRGNHV